ncbi:site-2 protease family protein [Paenibacillus sp. FJAT-26967]|uniref:site-2 protease family protein n=1 Tax=Paenibacillus sp. FJAT-26967 TaxID=1729690 RepID=UPI000838F5DF|nr:site-2 protease family protein [Paenibacillus sp. FJAT-26967]
MQLSQNPSSKTKKKNPLWVFGAILAFLLTQLKVLIPLLKLSKFGATFISIAITIAGYALIAPLPFAIGLVAMIFIHELGHVFAAKRKGLPVSAPLFIPFLGALITMKRNPRDAVTEAYIAYGGPLLGTIGATACFGLGMYLDSGILISIAYTGLFLNLINLLPIHPLDGGRISTAVTRWLWLVGLIGGLAVIVYLRSFLFLIIWIMFAWDLYKKFVKYRNKPQLFHFHPRFDMTAQHLLQQGYMIPGEDHKRNLDFTTYSDIGEGNTGVQMLQVSWDAIDFETKFELPRQSIVHRVQVTKIERANREDGLHLILHCDVELEPYDNDAYYEVPTASRWKFGIAYAGLAIYLLAMMNWIHGVLPPS